MTDKDHEDMTASELLRSGNSICGLCMMLTDGDCMNHGCLDIFTTLANKIDAEIVKAYSEKLNTCAMRWAKANGWPDFKDGEDFGAWLNRCALKLPCDKDGEPWHIDDRVCPSNTGETTVVGYIFNKETCYLKLRWCGEDGRANDLASMCKRPAPEVLGADGKPLNEDDTVYGTGREQHRYTVQVPYSINEAVGQRFCVQCYDHDEGNITWCDPSMLTHTPPDTQQKIDDDATMPPAEYCAVRGIDLGDDPDRATATEAMVLDLLRRQRRLDKRKGGAE